jgi:alcohol dehydrogenase class IV
MADNLMVPIRNFELYCPTRVLFGPGVANNAGAAVRSLGKKRVLVVTDPGIAGLGLLDGILVSLKKARLPYAVFSNVGREATLSKVYEGLEAQKNNNSDIILAVGGGSVLDTSKGIGCLATNPGPLPDYEGPEKYEIPPLPTVAIPTTAGTGSELSFGAVIFDEERSYKFSFRSAMQIPKIAILDPMLLRTTPPRLAAGTGMDALSHAVEAFVSQQATFITDAYCRQSFYLVGKYLRRYVSDPKDIEAASGMLMASAMGSMAFNTARLGLVHGMAHPLGAYFHLPHGVACAVLMPLVMEFNLMARPEKYADMALELEGAVAGERLMEMGFCAIEAIERLILDIGIEADFSGFDITAEKVSRLADETLQSGMHLTNPRVPSKDDVMAIFESLFEEWTAVE